MRRATYRRGFSTLELLVVVAVVVVALGVAVPSLLRASHTADVGEVETVLRSRIQTAIATAASRAEPTSLSPATAVGSAGVLVNPKFLTGPEDAVVAGTIVFEAGTGHPTVDGVRRPVAIVVVDRERPSEASAIVIGSSGTLRTYRRSGTEWEVRR